MHLLDTCSLDGCSASISLSPGNWVIFLWSATSAFSVCIPRGGNITQTEQSEQSVSLTKKIGSFVYWERGLSSHWGCIADKKSIELLWNEAKTEGSRIEKNGVGETESVTSFESSFQLCLKPPLTWTFQLFEIAGSFCLLTPTLSLVKRVLIYLFSNQWHGNKCWTACSCGEEKKRSDF